MLLYMLREFHQNSIWLHLQDCSAWTLELDLRPAKVCRSVRHANENEC